MKYSKAKPNIAALALDARRFHANDTTMRGKLVMAVEAVRCELVSVCIHI